MNRKNLWFVGVALVVGITIAYAASGDIVTWTGMGSRRNSVEFKITSATIGNPADLVPGANNANSIGIVTTNELKNGFFATGLGIPSNAAPRTNVTPARAGMLIFNSAGGEVCVSTGTLVSTWAKLSSPGTACAN
jgi:hypothetical protein